MKDIEGSLIDQKKIAHGLKKPHPIEKLETRNNLRLTMRTERS
jgi:hypothetical protein